MTNQAPGTDRLAAAAADCGQAERQIRDILDQLLSPADIGRVRRAIERYVRDEILVHNGVEIPENIRTDASVPTAPQGGSTASKPSPQGD